MMSRAALSVTGGSTWSHTRIIIFLFLVVSQLFTVYIHPLMISDLLGLKQFSPFFCHVWVDFYGFYFSFKFDSPLPILVVSEPFTTAGVRIRCPVRKVIWYCADVNTVLT